MRRTQTMIVVLAGLVSALYATPHRVHAQDANRSHVPSFHADAEIDPFAYAFAGYSVHVGVGYERLRVDLGAFAIDLPQLIEPSEGFDTSFSGYGLKLQYFPFAEQSGGFVGVGAVLAHALVEAEASDAASRQTRFSVDVQLGWRFLLGCGFYASPWVGASYDFGARDVLLAERRYEAPPLNPFATLHVGYRFR